MQGFKKEGRAYKLHGFSLINGFGLRLPFRKVKFEVKGEGRGSPRPQQHLPLIPNKERKLFCSFYETIYQNYKWVLILFLNVLYASLLRTAT